MSAGWDPSSKSEVSCKKVVGHDPGRGIVSDCLMGRNLNRQGTENK